MAKTNGRDKCAHPGCTCERTDDSKYCSPYCETAGDETEIECECGHPSCSGQIDR